MKTDNYFYLSIKDSDGNEISTRASINDPAHIPELEKMYVELVQGLDITIKFDRCNRCDKNEKDNKE